MKTIHFKMTCFACPEQYDGYIDGEQVAYLRLRHGHFRAEYKDRVVFVACPRGDGIFESEERHLYLNKAAKAILEAYEAEQKGVSLEEKDTNVYYTVERWEDYDIEGKF